jgi:flagellar hook-basal body complex protein FliE
MSEFQINRVGGMDFGGGLSATERGARSAGAGQKIEESLGQVQGPETPLAGDSATTFSDLLRKSVEKVNEHQVQADTAVKELLAGRNKNIHETMLSLERADSSLKLMMQVRNKVLEAYKEIMRMQV